MIPYSIGNPFPVDRFIGRREEIAALVSLVSAHGQSRTIIGEPRIGKTALLDHLAATALAADPAPGARRLHISPLNAHAFDATFDQATFWTEALDPLVASGLLAAPDTPLGAAYRQCREGAFSTRTLQRLLKALGAAGHRLVLLIDEFDYLVHRHLAAHSEFFAGLRALAIDPSRALALVMASRKPLKLLNKLASEHGCGGSPYFNAAPEILLGPFSDAEVEEFLRGAGDRVSADDRRFVEALSGGYPHLVQTAAAALLTIPASDPAQRRLAAGLALRREAFTTLDDIWTHWPSTNRHVFAAIAVEHLDALGAHVAWTPMTSNVADPATYTEEIDALEKHGFIAQTPHTPSGYLIRPLVFLAWCAVKLRGHAQSAREWSQWMDAEGWTNPRQRHLWDTVIRPRAAVVRTDLETLLAAHTALTAAAPAPPVAAFVPTAPRRVRLFYSHAAADQDYVDRLESHLSMLKRDNLLETWTSRTIGAGEDWRHESRAALESADIILVLVSADFLASDYRFGTELARARERIDTGDTRVLPIRLRPADWGKLWLGELDVLPAGDRAVTEWPNPDAAWAHVAAGIRKAVEEMAEVVGAPGYLSASKAGPRDPQS